MRAIEEAGICEHLVWIAGNHEFYRSDIDARRQQYRAAFEQHPKIHYLDDTAIELYGLTILGSTLWTGFNALGNPSVEEAMAAAFEGVADFVLISKAGGLFTPEHAAALHDQAVAFIDSTLSLADSARTITMTHFAPTRGTHNPLFPWSPISAYFQAGCEALIERHQPLLWCYGHNHWSDEQRLGRTLIASNQRGYPREQLLVGLRYRPTLVYDLDRLVETYGGGESGNLPAP